MDHPFIFWLVALTTLLGVTGDLPAQPVPGPQTLKVYATGDTDGKLAAPRCRQEPVLTDERLDYAHQVGFYNQLVESAAADSTTFDEPIALHLGDSVYPGPVGRFLLSEGVDGAEQFADILQQIPYASHTLGNGEMGMTRRDLLTFVEGSLDAGLPLRAANVVCTPEGGAEAVCEATGTAPGGQSWDVIRRGDLKIALISLLDPAVRSSISTSRMTGLDILEPTEVLQRTLPRARRRTGADMVFVQMHTDDQTDIESTVQLARQVDGIDLLLTTQPLGEVAETGSRTDNGFLVTPETGTYIIPSTSSPNHASVSTLHLGHDEARNRWRIERVEAAKVDTRTAPADGPTRLRLRAAAKDLCHTWGDPLSRQAPLGRTFQRSDFITFALNAMRFTVNAEVAFTNERAFLNSDNFPLTDQLTFADIYTIIPFGNPLVRLRLTGAELRGIAGRLGSGVVAEGLAKSGSRVTVNGRPIREDRHYSVVTNQFVADGGDDILAADAGTRRRVYEPDWSEQTPSVGDVIIRFVQGGLWAERGEVSDRLSPAGNFPDLHARFLWQLVGSLTASYNQVAIRNPSKGGAPAYDQSQLNVESTNQINLEGNLQANADSRNHGWDNGLLLQYATTRINPEDGGTYEETRDLIRGKSAYKYAGFHSRSGSRWWAPWPTVEVQVESEFDPPDERAWRKLEVTTIAGSAFRLADPLEVKIGADLRRDLNDPAGEALFGLAVAYRLERFDLFDVGGSPVQFESEFEYFFNDPGDRSLHELRTTSRLFYSLLDRLHVTSTFSAFAFRSGAVGSFGTNTEFTVGLNYLWDASFQTF